MAKFNPLGLLGLILLFGAVWDRLAGRNAARKAGQARDIPIEPDEWQ
jgi:hypothetical protein